jgi:hypothetical protein
VNIPEQVSVDPCELSVSAVKGAMVGPPGTLRVAELSVIVTFCTNCLFTTFKATP